LGDWRGASGGGDGIFGLAAVPSPKAAQKVKVGFALFEPHAQRVSLCGGFNAWSPEATPMNRQDGGLWEASLALPPGRHEYKFVVDGQWLPDPNAPEQVFNAHGTLNAVVQVRT
jgi:1,4-alpha-glucan branching enzyme